MEHSVSPWELALTGVLFAAAGGIGYASTVLLWELLTRRQRSQTGARVSDVGVIPVRRRRRRAMVRRRA